MKIFKKVLPLILIFLLLPINIFAYDMTADYNTQTNNFILEGRASEGDALRDISVLLLHKETGEIGHIGMTKVTDDGSYIYKFNFDGNINDYELKVRMDGKDLTGSIINEISTFTDSVIMDCNLVNSNGGTSFVDSIAFSELKTILTNKFENSVNVNVILAFYNAKNMLLKCESVYDEIIDYFDFNKEIKVNNIVPPTDATLFKVFCFKGLDTMKPLSGAVVGNNNSYDALYVSPYGSGDGKSYDSPTTFIGAKEIIRELKQNNKLPYGGLTVYLLGGNYFVEDTISFTDLDSGTKECPITYKAYKGENPVFTNGKYIPYSAFNPITSTDAMFETFPEDVRENILSVSLKDLGILDYGEILPLGDSITEGVAELRAELFVDDIVCEYARWPNKDNEVIENGYVYSEDVLTNVDTEENPTNTEKPVLVVSEDTMNRIASWKSKNSILCEGWYGWSYFANGLLLEGFSNEEKSITLSDGIRGGFIDWSTSDELNKKRNRFYFMNVPDELDIPGEFYIDRENGVLYLLPPDKMTENSSIGLTYNHHTMMTFFDGADYINLEGLSFELARKTVMSIDDSKNITIKDCAFKNASWEAIIVGMRYLDKDKDGEYDAFYGELDDETFEVTTKNITIDGCTFKNLGKGGVIAQGGSLRTLERANYTIKNCLFDSCDRILKNNGIAIYLRGCGAVITNCLIKNQICSGIFVGGGDIDVSYNEFENIVYDSSDLGAIYTCYMAFGVDIHNNYIHDIRYNIDNNREYTGKFGKNGKVFTFKQAVYIDGYSLGGSVRNNIIEDVPIGCHMRSMGLVLENNVFIDVPCVLYTTQNVKAQERYRADENGVVPPIFTDGTTDGLKVIRDNENISNLWYSRYPKVKEITDKLIERYNYDSATFCYPIIDYSKNLVFYDKLSDYYKNDIYDEDKANRLKNSMFGYSEFTTGGNTAINILFSLDKNIFADYDNKDYSVLGNAEVLNKAPDLIKIAPKKMGLK